MADTTQLDTDQILTFFDELGKRIEKTTSSLRGMGESSTKPMQQAGATVSALDKELKRLTSSLTGPVGLAAGFTLVARALDSFAVGQLQLSNLARNTGLAASQVIRLQAGFDRAGMSAEEGARQIGGLSSALDNIKMFREGSDVFGKIAQGMSTIGGRPLEDIILGFEKVGDRMSSIDAIMKSYNAGTAAWRLYLEGVFHTNAAGMKAMQDDLKGAVLLTQGNEEEVRKYHLAWVNLRNTVTNVWTEISKSGIDALNEVRSELEKTGHSAERFATGFKAFFEQNVSPTIKSTATDIVRIIDALDKAESWLKAHGLTGGAGKEGSDLLGTLGKPVKPDVPTITWGEWLKQKLQPPQKPEEGGGKATEPPTPLSEWLKQKFQRQKLEIPEGGGTITELSARARTEDDSNKLLRDIRDILQRSELKGWTGGSSGAGDVSSMTYGQGLRRSGGPLQSGLGGMRAGRVPGLLDGGKMPDGVAGDTRVAGSEFLASQRAKFAEELQNNPQTQSELRAIMSLEHESDPTAVVESLMNRMAMTGGTIEKGLHGGKGGSFYGPMRRGQVPGRAAAIDADPKRRARLDAAIAAALAGSNLIKGATDQGSAGDPNAGWMGGRMTRYGEIYNDWGGGPGGHEGARKFREQQQAQVSADRSRAYHGLTIDEGQRSNLDRSMRGAPGPSGELKGEIDFKNVPPGVSTRMSGTGFKMLRVTASKQNQKALEGMMSPGDSMYTPFVP